MCCPRFVVGCVLFDDYCVPCDVCCLLCVVGYGVVGVWCALCGV